MQLKKDENLRFSIIIPVYNVEKYIRKCLESVERQTYKNYEVIIVNDGSLDHSQDIVDEFVKKYPTQFQSFKKTNGGLSDARNYGIQKAKGEYLVFLDADDYIDETLLEKANQKIEAYSKLDLIRLSICTIKEQGKDVENFEEKFFSGEELFFYLNKKRSCIEPAWSYIVKKTYWTEKKFTFPKGKLHEDFAIMLLVVLKAKKTCLLNDVHYNYVIRQNSIMTNTSYENELRKVNDKLEHYDYMVKELEKDKSISVKAKKICLEYISTAICMGLRKIEGKEKKKYQKQLKNRKVLKNFKLNDLKSLYHKLIFFVNIYIY